MPFYQPEKVRYFVFDSLQGSELTHAIFTRKGGVSQSPWAELNMGGTVGDDPNHVSENRRRAFMTIGREVDSLYDVWQVHSADVVKADSPRPLHVKHLQADAIITDQPEVTLVMRFADCVPILLYDPMRKAVGLVHAGWQGTVKKVIVHAVEAMGSAYGSRPGDLQAAIGPSIGPDHYEIGPDVIAQVQSSFGSDSKALLAKHNESHHFDLWQANRVLLERCGVRQIELAGICTACHTEDWFSHRGEYGKTGRFGAILAVNK